MSDTTLSISQVMKDSLQLEMNDLSIKKYLTEQMRANMRDGNINQLFETKYKSQLMVEGYTKTGATNYSQIDWYVRPEKNGTDYLTTS